MDEHWQAKNTARIRKLMTERETRVYYYHHHHHQVCSFVRTIIDIGIESNQDLMIIIINGIVPPVTDGPNDGNGSTMCTTLSSPHIRIIFIGGTV